MVCFPYIHISLYFYHPPPSLLSVNDDVGTLKNLTESVHRIQDYLGLTIGNASIIYSGMPTYKVVQILAAHLIMNSSMFYINLKSLLLP